MLASEKPGTGKTALITGPTAGIGYDLAKEFARDGYDLVLASRNEQRLREVADEIQKEHAVSAVIVPTDLADPHAPKKLYDALRRQSIRIDVLVNNAGFGTYGLFADTDTHIELAVIQVNLTALTHLTKLFLRDMLERNCGAILNVASTGAFQPGPWMAVYYATKAYVLSFSEAIARELRGTGVRVSALCPGATRTEFQKRAGMEDTRLLRGQVMDSATVARIGYRQFKRGKTVIITGLQNRLLALAVRLAPRNLITRIVDRIMRPVDR